jgi:hypothetical protein
MIARKVIMMKVLLFLGLVCFSLAQDSPNAHLCDGLPTNARAQCRRNANAAWLGL